MPVGLWFHVVESSVYILPEAMPTYCPALRAAAVARSYCSDAYVQPASLHMCGCKCNFDRQPKNDATTLAVSSRDPCVHPTNPVKQV